MGNAERCPKCKSTLRYEPAGYAIVKKTDGDFGGKAPGHYTCWCCGYYRTDTDARPDVEITTEDKHPNKYPTFRKEYDPGWVKAIVVKELATINRLKANRNTWDAIWGYFVRKYPELQNTTKQAFSCSWRREVNK